MCSKCALYCYLFNLLCSMHYANVYYLTLNIPLRSKITQEVKYKVWRQPHSKFWGQSSGCKDTVQATRWLLLNTNDALQCLTWWGAAPSGTRYHWQKKRTGCELVVELVAPDDSRQGTAGAKISGRDDNVSKSAKQKHIKNKISWLQF